MSAFVGSGTCGEDVINEYDGFVQNGGPVSASHLEGSMKVFQSFCPTEACLRFRIAESCQCVDPFQVMLAGHVLDDFLGLIESAFTEPLPVEGDGDEQPVFKIGEKTCVVQSFAS